MARPRRRITKQLLCAVCGNVVATAQYTRFPLTSLVVTSVEGRRLLGVAAARELGHCQERLEHAADRDRPDLEARLAFLREHQLEIVYDLRRRRGHAVLRTMPQIVRSMTRVAGSVDHALLDARVFSAG